MNTAGTYTPQADVHMHTHPAHTSRFLLKDTQKHGGWKG